MSNSPTFVSNHFQAIRPAPFIQRAMSQNPPLREHYSGFQVFSPLRLRSAAALTRSNGSSRVSDGKSARPESGIAQISGQSFQDLGQ